MLKAIAETCLGKISAGRGPALPAGAHISQDVTMGYAMPVLVARGEPSALRRAGQGDAVRTDEDVGA